LSWLRRAAFNSDVSQQSLLKKALDRLPSVVATEKAAPEAGAASDDATDGRADSIAAGPADS